MIRILDKITTKKLIRSVIDVTNLSDILVRARLNQVFGKITNVCAYTNNIVCIYCRKVDTLGNIMCTNSGRMYKTSEGGSCGSNNLVYQNRFCEHFYDWRNLKYQAKAPPSALDKKPSAVAKHFCLNGHGLDDIKIQILEHISQTTHAEKHFETQQNKGTSLDIPVENSGTNGFKYYVEYS